LSPRRARVAALVGFLALLAPAPGHSEASPGAEVEAVWVDAIPRGPSVAERLELIRRRLQAALVYPPLARQHGIEGVTTIEFEIGPAGRAAGVRTTASSGSELLDRAAERCAVDAGQLPRIFGRLVVPIRFDLESAP
jgi:TonB family protein